MFFFFFSTINFIDGFNYTLLYNDTTAMKLADHKSVKSRSNHKMASFFLYGRLWKFQFAIYDMSLQCIFCLVTDFKIKIEFIAFELKFKRKKIDDNIC